VIVRHIGGSRFSKNIDSTADRRMLLNCIGGPYPCNAKEFRFCLRTTNVERERFDSTFLQVAASGVSELTLQSALPERVHKWEQSFRA
jgi:hypothetical protein